MTAATPEMKQMAKQLKILTEKVETMECENKQAMAEAKKNPKGFKRKTFLYYGTKGPAETIVGAGTLVASIATANPLGILAGGVSLAAGINSTIKFFKNLKVIRDSKKAKAKVAKPIIKVEKTLKAPAFPDAGFIFGEDYADKPQEEKTHVNKLMNSRTEAGRVLNPPVRPLKLQLAK